MHLYAVTLTLEPCRSYRNLRLREQRIRREQRARLVNLGEKVYWVTDEEGVQ